MAIKVNVHTVKTPAWAAMLNLDLSKELNMCAEIVKKNIRKRMKAHKDIRGVALTPLAAKTIKRKASSGNPTVSKNAKNPMLATENLLKNQVVDKATKTNQVVTISIGPTRSEIYGYHHNGEGSLPQRQTFGIGPDDPAEFQKLIIYRIDSALSKL